MDGRLIYIDMGYATYGIVVCDRVVVDAPPIAAWMLGKPTSEVRAWLISKGAEIVPL